MADSQDVPKRPRTDGLGSEVTLSFKATQHMNERLTDVAVSLEVSKSEAIRLAVVDFITKKKGQYIE